MNKTVRLREVGSTYGGLIGKTKRDFGKGQAKYVTFLEVINNTRLRSHSLGKVQFSRGEQQNRVERGDILFNGSSEIPEEIALAAVVDFDPSVSTFLNSFCFGFRLKPHSKVDPVYLAYFFRSYAGRLLVSTLAQGATRYNIARTKFLDIELPLPSPDRQHEIVEWLNDADDLIMTLERLIVKIEAMKQGMMQQLITGRTRLPGFDGTWQQIRLGEVGSCYGGLAGKNKEDFGSGSGTFVTFMEVIAGARLVGASLERVNVRTNENQNQVLRGDVLFNGSSETPREVALATVVDFDTSPQTYLNSFCFGYRIKEKDRIDPTYLAYFFRSDKGRELVLKLAQGATRYNIAKTKLLQLAPILPSIEEQRAIVKAIIAFEAEIDALNLRLVKTHAIKQGMMQQLLTGRIRLPMEDES